LHSLAGSSSWAVLCTTPNPNMPDGCLPPFCLHPCTSPLVRKRYEECGGGAWDGAEHACDIRVKLPAALRFVNTTWPQKATYRLAMRTAGQSSVSASPEPALRGHSPGLCGGVTLLHLHLHLLELQTARDGALHVASGLIPNGLVGRSPRQQCRSAYA